MQVHVSDDPARYASAHAASSLKQILAERKTATILAATGRSQLRFLELLTSDTEINWSLVQLFHLDEYVGIGADHRASFAGYIKEHIIARTGIKAGTGIKRFHLLDGLAEPASEVRKASEEIRAVPVDIAFCGIGENGHLAFNDPPADFETEDPYVVVQLDDLCRQQQVDEGWFASLPEVPRQAISISIHQLMKAQEIICTVPDLRKARAVAACLDGDVSPDAPASILRLHPNAWLYLDRDSASLLRSSLPIN